jgi:hypothetical protein
MLEISANYVYSRVGKIRKSVRIIPSESFGKKISEWVAYGGVWSIWEKVKFWKLVRIFRRTNYQRWLLTMPRVSEGK